MVEKRRGHLRTAGVVNAREKDGLHEGKSHRNVAVAAPAPRSWTMMKPGASLGRMPANVSLAERARVTAGFANEVEDVNQYAAVM
jgi:hypothetical protein